MEWSSDVFSSVIMFLLCKQKTAYDMRISDWSSDVCSSDLRNYRCWSGRRVPERPLQSRHLGNAAPAHGASSVWNWRRNRGGRDVFGIRKGALYYRPNIDRRRWFQSLTLSDCANFFKISPF